MKVVIVGGVAGGATAAARIRRLDESADIKVFERSGYISYANCGLPYYIGGVITDSSELTLQTPESFWSRFRVSMKVHHEVTAIDPERKVVTVHDLDADAVFEEPYDKLLLAPGAKPTRPRLQGLDSGRLFTLRTVEDTLRIRSFVEKERPRSAVLAGGGYIGLEVAENLRNLGMEVTIVQSHDHLMVPLDRDMASFVHSRLRSAGVSLLLSRSVEGFEDRDRGIDVLVSGGNRLHADMAILAIGVTPDTSFAYEAGLAAGGRPGSIAVNDRMETSVRDIYAVGDAVEIRNVITGRPSWIALAGPANKEARVAADNICGKESHYRGSLGSSVIKLFDQTVATMGINESAAKAASIDYDRIYLSPSNHAGYYPGGRTMTMKILFEKGSYRLLGAQIIGYEGVDKRIDVLATAAMAGLSVIDLKDLDLAYAPPYSSAKDPVNMAGFMAGNISEGILHQFFFEDVEGLPCDGSVTLLDTRTPAEYGRGHIEGFANIPVDELRERLQEIPHGRPVYVICQSGLRSYIACRILSQHGYECYNFSGGYRLYEAIAHDKEAAREAYPCGMDR